MKALKMSLMVLLAVILILPVLSVSQAQAALQYVPCYVNTTGQAWDTKLVQLTAAGPPPLAVDHTWFTIDNSFGGGASMLSICLTAMASGMKVNVYCDPFLPYSNVAVIYLMDQ